MFIIVVGKELVVIFLFAYTYLSVDSSVVLVICKFVGFLFFVCLFVHLVCRKFVVHNRCG